MYKWSHYFDVYHKHFERFRGKPIKVLEIGIYGGGSLQMWKWYFGDRAKVTGVDIDPYCKKYEESQIKIKIGDQADKKFLSKLGMYDIIIDDGGHTMKQQITSFAHLYDKVKPNGVYLVEDTHTSYMDAFQDHPITFIDYSKKLVDVMHTHYKGEPFNTFSAGTNSITYYDSIVVFEKQLRTMPTQTFHSGKNRS